MADACDPIRSRLHALEAQLAKTDRVLGPEPGEQHPSKPRPNPEWITLAGEVASERRALRACEESNRRFTVTGTGFPGSLELDGVVSRFMKAHDIRAAAAGQKQMTHPKKGVLRFEHASFQANDDPTLKLVIYTPV